MASNSPLYSAGASGLGSNVSKWVGPPSIQTRMHDFALAVGVFTASAATPLARNAVTSPPPSSVPSPSWRQSRRETPLQFVWAGMVKRLSCRSDYFGVGAEPPPA